MFRFLIIHILLLFAANYIVIAQIEEDYKMDRTAMVIEQLKSRGISHKETLKAMEKVPRHLFIPEGYLERAYDDNPLPIGYGQTISQPFMVAYMTEVIKPNSSFKVLEIGTGSGYQAAILAEIVDSVFSVEIIPELANDAKKLLNKLKYNNIYIKSGDGYYGWKEHAPYDAIIVTAAATYIPPPLIKQLKPEGIMIIPVGHPYQVQQLVMVKKKGDKVKTNTLFPVKFVPFMRSNE